MGKFPRYLDARDIDCLHTHIRLSHNTDCRDCSETPGMGTCNGLKGQEIFW
jgi:hypothetical protein